ncbi:hypothetical protein [Deinococcus sp. AJ005]|uniref:hypothetical protein n=1 Tax=Deinococcus sp. AJ005 TaxID=2652443 RepID=UPI00125CD1C5|nr:hypothetical protein [Deinococcus sp. AJ005]QFP78559.1 hypothetical protein DAAJ005_18485 [Deinococcus sp. AJ005]
MKRFAMLALLLSACAPATAQLQVSAPITAPCTEGGTLIPVLGIGISTYFEGDNGTPYASAVKKALQDVGFKVYPSYEYKLIDKASVTLSGSVTNWTSRSGEESSKRVGKVNLLVTDLATDMPILKLEQASATVAWQAPTREVFVQGVAQSIQARFCQIRG